MLENKEKIYNLRAYDSKGFLFLERIFTELRWAIEFKDKLFDNANKEGVNLFISIVPMMKDEKWYQPYWRGLMQFEN